jgi:hypothetical protein
MKRREERPPAPVAARPAARSQPPRNRLVRWLLNLCIFLHFSAIIAAASIVGPSPSYMMAVWEVFHPYLEALFLNHGYNFFAPEPSPSTLMTFQAVRADGSVVNGRIPEPSIRPGLLYQRHLLLTEHIGVLQDDLKPGWYRAYARHLCRKYQASKVHLTLLTHYPLPVEMVRGGGRLDSPLSYDTTDLGDFPCEGP